MIFGALAFDAHLGTAALVRYWPHSAVQAKIPFRTRCQCPLFVPLFPWYACRITSARDASPAKKWHKVTAFWARFKRTPPGLTSIIPLRREHVPSKGAHRFEGSVSFARPPFEDRHSGLSVLYLRSKDVGLARRPTQSHGHFHRGGLKRTRICASRRRRSRYPVDSPTGRFVGFWIPGLWVSGFQTLRCDHRGRCARGTERPARGCPRSLAVTVVLPRIRIHATEGGPTDASGDAVINADPVFNDELAPGVRGHEWDS